MTSCGSTCSCSSTLTTTAADSRRCAASRPTSSFARPGRNSLNASGSIRHTKCRDRTVFRVRQSSLEAYLPRFDAQWDAGSLNATEIWRQAKLEGFRGLLRTVGEWAMRRRRAEQANIERLQRVPSAPTLARWLTTGRDRLTKAKTMTKATVEDAMPALIEAREVVGAFQTMVRAMEPSRPEGWLRRAEASLVASFARGIGQDRSAVQAAITLPWSNGQITKLKLVKRQMYGRGKIDLLQARLIGLTPR